MRHLLPLLVLVAACVTVPHPPPPATAPPAHRAAASAEVAAWAAVLTGDGEAAWAHFLRAASDLDSDATELYLWQLGSEPRAQAEESARLLERLRAESPRPAVRALAALHLARLDQDYGR